MGGDIRELGWANVEIRPYWLLQNSQKVDKKASSLVVYLNTEEVLVVRLGKTKMRISMYDCKKSLGKEKGEGSGVAGGADGGLENEGRETAYH